MSRLPSRDGVAELRGLLGKLRLLDAEVALLGSTLDGAPPGQERRPRWTSALCLRCPAWRGSLGLEPTPELYVQHLVEIFREVRRVLRKDGTLWLNMGDTYGGSTTLGRNDAGRNFTGGGGNRPGSGNPGRQGEHERDIGLKPKDLVGMPWRVAFALQADGWWVRSDIIWSKPNPMPESVEDRPTKSHEYLFLLSKAARYYYDQEAIKEPQEEQERTRRIREQAQGLDTRYTIARDEHHVGQAPHGKDGVARSVAARHALALLGTRNRRTVWEIATEPFPEAHFATFPRALVEPCVKAGSREGDIVLDPFCGSGTAVLVAQELGRTGIGLDLKMEYLAMARKRTRQGVLL